MLYITILLGAVLFAGVAMTINEGLWSNTIMLLLIILAGLMAIVAGVPLGTWGLEQSGKDASFAWYFRFAGIWGVFFLSLAVMRVIADKISRTRMRFLPVIDKIAGPLMGIFVAVMFTSFAAYTLWKLPVAAGQWEKSELSETQKSIFAYAQAPFHSVQIRFFDAEDITSPLASKK